ncbi:MAG: hypothetical protein KGY81_05315 [Phycisphaerae bacterium]|nr:hypothetical protein [Phycisphaerae bacterium]
MPATRVVLHWLAGLALATLAAWAIGAVALSDVFIWQHDDVTGRWLPQPNTPYTYTREGWGRTTWQRHGRLAERLPGADDPTVIFWGDSYVEALQVDDDAKMFNVFTRLAGERGSNLCGVGVALSGWGLGDYHDLLAKLDGRLGRPVRHVFVVQMKDLLPRHVDGQPIEPMDLIPPHTPQFVSIRPWVYRLKLSAFWSLPRDAAETLRSLRLAPGPAGPKQEPVCYCRLNEADLRETWCDMFVELQQRAEAPMAFVLLPETPEIRDGNVAFEPTDHNSNVYGPFVETCRQQNVPCLDMRERFNDFYRRTGRFPRGFANTPPGTGHLNADGHALVANAVADWLLGEAQNNAPQTRTNSLSSPRHISSKEPFFDLAPKERELLQKKSIAGGVRAFHKNPVAAMLSPASAVCVRLHRQPVGLPASPSLSALSSPTPDDDILPAKRSPRNAAAKTPSLTGATVASSVIGPVKSDELLATCQQEAD